MLRLLPSADNFITKFTIFLYYVAVVFGYVPVRLETLHRQRTYRLRPLSTAMRCYSSLTAASAVVLLGHRFWTQFFGFGLRYLATLSSLNMADYCIVLASCCFILSAIYFYNRRHQSFYRLCKALWQLQQHCRSLSVQHLGPKAPFFCGTHALLLLASALLLAAHFGNFVLYQMFYRMLIAPLAKNYIDLSSFFSSLLPLGFLAYTQALVSLCIAAYVLALLYLDAALLLLRQLLDSQRPMQPAQDFQLNCLLIAVRRHLWSAHRIRQQLNALCSAALFWIYAYWFLWSIFFMLFTYFNFPIGDSYINVVIMLCAILTLNFVASGTARRFREACNALDRHSRQRKRHINLHDHQLQIVSNDFHFGCYRLFRFDCGLTLAFCNALLLYVTTELQMAMAWDLINNPQHRNKKRLTEKN